MRKFSREHLNNTNRRIHRWDFVLSAGLPSWVCRGTLKTKGTSLDPELYLLKGLERLSISVNQGENLNDKNGCVSAQWTYPHDWLVTPISICSSIERIKNGSIIQNPLRTYLLIAQKTEQLLAVWLICQNQQQILSDHVFQSFVATTVSLSLKIRTSLPVPVLITELAEADRNRWKDYLQ